MIAKTFNNLSACKMEPVNNQLDPNLIQSRQQLINPKRSDKVIIKSSNPFYKVKKLIQIKIVEKYEAPDMICYSSSSNTSKKITLFEYYFSLPKFRDPNISLSKIPSIKKIKITRQKNTIYKYSKPSHAPKPTDYLKPSKASGYCSNVIKDDPKIQGVLKKNDQKKFHEEY